MKMVERSCQSCIRGCHVYMDALVGEELICKPQDKNSSDSYAVAVLRTCDDKIVGHLPYLECASFSIKSLIVTLCVQLKGAGSTLLI